MIICSQCHTVLGARVQTCPKDGAATERVEGLPVGATLGPYHIDGLMGEGGMGFVYEATHQVLNRRSALKILRPEYSSNASVVTRFLQEAKAVNVINHRHIVNVYDYGDDIEGLVYFVMEYLEGQTLQDLLKKSGPMAPALIAHIYTQILQGLAAAHEKQIIHRDLKPENVFIISRSGNPLFVKLLDFGVAKLRGEGKVDGLTGQGALIGTPQYMSPEQLSGKPVDARSDVFSLGIMMYEAASGKRPFPGSDLAQLAIQILQTDPAPLDQVVPGFPPSLQAFIEKALSKDADQRFKDAGEMLAALGPIYAELDPQQTNRKAILRGYLKEQNDDITLLQDASWSDMPRFVEPAPTRPASSKSSGGGNKTALIAGAAVLALAAGGALFALGGGSEKAGSSTAAQQSATSTEQDKSPDKTDLVALSDLKDPPALLAEARAQMQALWAGADPAKRAAMVDALHMLASKTSLPILLQALDSAPKTLAKAAHAIALLEEPEAIEPLAAAMEAAGAQLKIDLAASLLALGDERGMELIKQGLEAPATRFAAARAMILHGADNSDETLQTIRTVFQETPPWRGHWQDAAEVLLMRGDAPTSSAMVEAVKTAESASQRIAAADLLAREGDETAISFLSDTVADARAEARAEAAFALARIGHEDAALYVPVGFMSNVPEEQVASIAILTRVGGDELAKQARRLAELTTTTPHDNVRMAALAALAHLSSQQ